MSVHLVDCAARLALKPSTKLALMCFADSAPLDTRIGLPGLEAVMTWACVEKSQANDIVKELTALGLLRKHAPGHRGRRAEYIVMPNGCCAEHPMPVDERLDEAPGWPDPNAEKGSGVPESTSVTGSGGPDPIQPPDREGSGGPDPVSEKGSGLGPVGRTPSLTTTTNPPTPQAGHHGQHPNCRGCGTNGRQAEDDQQRQAAADRRAASDADIQASRRRRAETRDVDAHAHAAAARELLGKTGGRP